MEKSKKCHFCKAKVQFFSKIDFLSVYNPRFHSFVYFTIPFLRFDSHPEIPNIELPLNETLHASGLM